MLSFITDPLGRALGFDPAVGEEWKELTDGSFKGYVFHVALPSKKSVHGASRVEVKTDRRLQAIKRPLRDGAGVRDFGQDPRTFTAEVVFFGPSYQFELQEFKKRLNEGTPGVLTLPDLPTSVIAYFQSMTESSSHDSGNSKSLNVTWLEHTEDTSDLPSDGGVFRLSPEQAKTELKASLARTSTILQSNPFLKAVRLAEGGLSAARSLTNAVLSLDEGVRNRIKQLDANLQSTLDFTSQGVAVLENAFRGKGSRAKSAPPPSGTDPETGQRVVEFLDGGSGPVSDPLAKPPAEPEETFDPEGVRTPAKAEQYAGSVAESLKRDTAELAELAGGRVDDLAGAMTGTTNALATYLSALSDRTGRRVIVPIEMSLLEVMFQNGVGVDQLDAVYRQNSHIADPLVVPKGAVVRL